MQTQVLKVLVPGSHFLKQLPMFVFGILVIAIPPGLYFF